MTIGTFLVLIDANVWSELVRVRPDPNVAQWMRDNFDSCILSTIVLGEIRYGIELSEGARRQELEAFLNDVLIRLKTDIASFDEAAAHIWAPMRASLKRSGSLIGERDMLIAAQAMSLGVPLVTRNVSEMERTGAVIINPWGI